MALRPTAPSYLPMALLLVPSAIGLVLGWVSEKSFLSAFLLMGEPLLLALGVYGVAALAWHRRFVAALALAAGFVVGGLAVRLPPVPQTPPSAKAEWIGKVQDCANDARPVGAPVRVLSWTARADLDIEQQVETLQLERPDVVVVYGEPGAEVAAKLATAMGGESKDMGGDIALAVRGVFSYCSGRAVGDVSNEDSWEALLPTAGDREAKLVVTFPGVEGVGVFPLMVVRLDAPGSLTEWRAWPHRLDEGARITSAVARTVGSRRMVVVGDFEAPSTFRHLMGHLLGAGLTQAPGPPNWPTRLGPLPMLPVHALDHVWLGSGWVAGDVRAIDGAGLTRRPLVVDLVPNEATAR